MQNQRERQAATRDPLDRYIPNNVPHGLPHVVSFATLSSADLPIEARFLIIILARFANAAGPGLGFARHTLRDLPG